jgi:hypothetical protein
VHVHVLNYSVSHFVSTHMICKTKYVQVANTIQLHISSLQQHSGPFYSCWSVINLQFRLTIRTEQHPSAFFFPCACISTHCKLYCNSWCGSTTSQSVYGLPCTTLADPKHIQDLSRHVWMHSCSKLQMIKVSSILSVFGGKIAFHIP